MVSFIIRLENLIIFILSLAAFYLYGESWWWFLTWILPDLGMVGYLKDTRIGALTYDLCHTYLFGLLIVGVGLLLQDNLVTLGIIFCSHTALDRFLGFGLKYRTHYKDTHIQRL